jgi:hypothetical protein
MVSVEYSSNMYVFFTHFLNSVPLTGLQALTQSRDTMGAPDFLTVLEATYAVVFMSVPCRGDGWAMKMSELALGHRVYLPDPYVDNEDLEDLHVHHSEDLTNLIEDLDSQIAYPFRIHTFLETQDMLPGLMGKVEFWHCSSLTLSH